MKYSDIYKYKDGGKSKQNTSPYKTKLTNKEEIEFKNWYNKVSNYKKLNPNPDLADQYYDYRGYWKNEDKDEILKDNSEAHFIDKYKQPGHPTFSNESIYSNEQTKGGSWSQDKNGVWYFSHSPYTEKYLDRTANYLDNTGEFSITTQNDTIRNPNDFNIALLKLKKNELKTNNDLIKRKNGGIINYLKNNYYNKLKK